MTPPFTARLAAMQAASRAASAPTPPMKWEARRRWSSRVLRSGGRLAIADNVSASPLKEAARRNTELWAACIAGAIPLSSYLDALTESGFAVTGRRRTTTGS